MADFINITGFNLLPEVAAQMPEIASKLVRKAAFDIQANAAINAPVDTGFLKASIYVETSNSSDYDERAAEAEGANPNGQMLPALETPTTPTLAYIGVGANYGIYVELGTVNAAAQPYLLPAAEAVYPQFKAAMEKITDLLEL